jgi:hypothetical protein
MKLQYILCSVLLVDILGSHIGIKITVFCDVLLCSLVDGYQCFEGTCCLAYFSTRASAANRANDG